MYYHFSPCEGKWALGTRHTPAPGTPASRCPVPGHRAGRAARGRCGRCGARWVPLERPGQPALRRGGPRAEPGWSAMRQAGRVRGSPLPTDGRAAPARGLGCRREVGGRASRRRLHSPGSVPLLAFVGFELRPPPRWGTRRQSVHAHGSRREGCYQEKKQI